MLNINTQDDRSGSNWTSKGKGMNTPGGTALLEERPYRNGIIQRQGTGSTVLKINQIIRYNIGRETRRPAGTARDVETTDYEVIPRLFQPINQQQNTHCTRRSKLEEQLRNQQRAGRWRNGQNQGSRVTENKRRFKVGADQLRASLIPTHLQIVEELEKGAWSNHQATAGRRHIRVAAEEIHRGRTVEDNTIQELLKQWDDGAHRYVPDTKDDNIILPAENEI